MQQFQLYFNVTNPARSSSRCSHMPQSTSRSVPPSLFLSASGDGRASFAKNTRSPSSQCFPGSAGDAALHKYFYHAVGQIVAVIKPSREPRSLSPGLHEKTCFLMGPCWTPPTDPRLPFSPGSDHVPFFHAPSVFSIDKDSRRVSILGVWYPVSLQKNRFTVSTGTLRPHTQHLCRYVPQAPRSAPFVIFRFHRR